MRVEDKRPPDRDGRTLELVLVLQHLWTYAQTTKSDFVREHADSVAEAASRGFITTAVVPNGDVYGRLWKPTASGTRFLFANADLIQNTQEAEYVANYCG